MANQNALIDENSRQSMLGVLNTDGTTLTRPKASATGHGIMVENNTTGSNNGGPTAGLDQNGRQTLYVESSANDGTFVALYIDSSGRLLVDSS